MTAQRRGLYPEIEPYESGMLDVDDGHSLYWERCGTRGAKPAIFLHGGPGAGCNADHRRQFDPARYDILLFDQRGCGRSKPHAGLEANTTWHLVADIERLRQLAGVDRWMVYGGSWGSTLALAYAQTHPDRCTELVLRGIFTFRQSEIDWLYRFGASEVYPDKWEDFLGAIPEAERADPVTAYQKLLTGDDIPARLRAAQAWSQWEGETVTLLPDPKMLEEFTEDNHALAIARIENHYMVHKGWLDEGQLLANASQLRSIPGVIVQGRHDMCTPAVTAWDLHRAWPQAEINIIADGGHLFTEPGVLDALVRTTDRFVQT